MYDSESDDEFPNLQVVARRARQQKAPEKADASAADKENKPARALKPKAVATGAASVPASLSNGTPLRRRKLGYSQNLDDSLFQKWNEDTETPKPRASRVRSREVRRTTLGISQGPSEEAESRILESDDDDEDDDVFVRRRQPARASIRNPRKVTPELQQKTEPDISITEEGGETTIEETVEVSHLIADDDNGKDSSSDDTSEFVTALSLDSDSDSDADFDSPSDFDPVPKPRRARGNPKSQPLGAVRLSPPQNSTKKEKDTTKAKPTPAPSYRAATPEQMLDTPQTPEGKSRKAALKGGSLEDAFDKLQIYAEELDDSPDAKQKPQLEPMTPRKTLQASPLKAPKIPPSPWKPEQKEFWDAEVQNEWFDRHSPPKRSPRKLVLEGPDKKEMLKKKYGTSPEKRDAKKAFEQAKESLAQDFLRELDESLTSGELSKLTALTGGVRIVWSTTLKSTAGRAHWKCKEVTKTTQQADGALKSVKERRHEAKIELASKVLSNEDQLLNTVAHEFCHLAVYMVDGKTKVAHGAEFKAWGRRCMKAFGDRGIEVTTKHSYEIDHKYMWRCAECANEYGRHSRSINPAKHKCGRCRGLLEQVKPVPRAAGKGKSAYQEFVSKEMKVLKAEGRALTFKEMMAQVSTRWKAQQAEKQGSQDTLNKKELQGLEDEFEELAVVDLEAELGDS
ncbi:hypothetical protein JX265_009140 [Neoarthrinium moseri]|uniref:SprT-like domain-containing protein n=1 Tax=Neoarthrinium moseri TaxID=1658444 RepID=A0A9Q0ALS1_9PEZI|nr:hypothetical protein JX265_009140 [Neoarthrinium moseri]